MSTRAPAVILREEVHGDAVNGLLQRLTEGFAVVSKTFPRKRVFGWKIYQARLTVDSLFFLVQQQSNFLKN